MQLICDFGNTFYKFYIFENDEVLQYYKAICPDEGLKIFDLLLKQKNINIKNIIISSVKNNNDIVFNEISNKTNAVIFSKNLKLPLKINYKTPETLGNDRLAAVCAAYSLYPNSDVLVVDAGTAITYDLIVNSEYIGGNISPGLKTRFRALHTFTGKLPLLDIDVKKDNFIGCSTNDAIILGVQNGLIFEVDTYINILKQKYPKIINLFTGGDAFFFEKSLKNKIFVSEFLVAIGLKKILDLNA